jgi:hypothetical protein
MFKQWVNIWRNKPKSMKINIPSRAVPAIEIDTELANAQYENQNDMEKMEDQIGGHL